MPEIFTGSKVVEMLNPPPFFAMLLTFSNLFLLMVLIVVVTVVYLLPTKLSPVTKVPFTCSTVTDWPEIDFTNADAPEVWPDTKSPDAKLWLWPVVIVSVS